MCLFLYCRSPLFKITLYDLLNVYQYLKYPIFKLLTSYARIIHLLSNDFVAP